MADEFVITSSIRRDGILLQIRSNDKFSASPSRPHQLYMLSHHHERMLAAARAFGWSRAALSFSDATGVQGLEAALDTHVRSSHTTSELDRPLRVRIQLSRSGDLTFVSAPTPPVHPAAFFPVALAPPGTPPQCPSAWTIRLCNTPVPSSLFTAHKTSSRAHYDGVRGSLPVTTELLLQNEAGEISEGSLTTPYFWRGGRWVTPPAESGGNLGTTRRLALEHGLAVEQAVRAEDVQAGERIWVSNGVRGWGWGVVEQGGGCNPAGTLMNLAE